MLSVTLSWQSAMFSRCTNAKRLNQHDDCALVTSALTSLPSQGHGTLCEQLSKQGPREGIRVGKGGKKLALAELGTNVPLDPETKSKVQLYASLCLGWVCDESQV